MAAFIAALLASSPASAEVNTLEVQEYQADFGVSYAEAEANLETQHRGAQIVTELKQAFGNRYAGIWFDNEAGEFVVPLLPDADRAAIASIFAKNSLRSGYRTAQARFSWAQLNAAQAQLDNALQSQLEDGLVATSLDPGANAVVIDQAGNMGKAAQAKIDSEAAELGGRAEIQAESAGRLGFETMGCLWVIPGSGSCDPPYRAGVAIHSGGCTGAFKAYGNFYGDRYVLTAGHCGSAGTLWHARNSTAESRLYALGSAEQVKYDSEGDWAKIKVTGGYWDVTPWPAAVVTWAKLPDLLEFFYDYDIDPAVTESYPINGTGSSYRGMYVCHSGATTGSSCGPVTDMDTSIVFRGGMRVNHVTLFGPACGDHGDSGGPVFAGNLAYGIYKGGDDGVEKPGDVPLPTCQRSNAYHEISAATADLGVSIATSSSQPPTVTTNDATSVREFQADVSGSVNPNGSTTTYHFEYGPTPSYGNSIPIPDGNAGSGSSAVSVSATLTRLEPGTTYHYRLVATNAGGTSYGESKSFHTPGYRFMRGLSNGAGVSNWRAALSMALPSRMAAADVNNDGKDDVISVEYDGNSSYRYRLGLSNGSGIPSWSTILSGMGKPDRMGLGDVNADGKADIVSVEPQGDGRYRYMFGLSNGTGVASWSQVLSGMGLPTKMAIGDFTGDGKADIVAVEPQGNGNYRYMLGVSNGTGISSWGEIPALGQMAYAEFMDLGDVNADGKADILSVEAEGDGQYRFMFGLSNGVGVGSWSQVMGNMAGPYFFKAGDVNNDGKDDIVSVEAQGDGRYRYMFGTSNGTGIGSWSQVMSNMSLPTQSDLGDLTGDGKADIVSVETESTGSYTYMLGTSNGAGIASWNQMLSWMRPPARVAVGDVNNDGKDDIVAVESEGNGRYRYKFGFTDSLGEVSNWKTVLSGMGLPNAMDLGDVNADGKADIVAVEPQGDGRYRFMFGISNGTGISSWSQVMSGMGLPTRFSVGDVSGNGKADIVAVEPQGDGRYRYMFGLSNGTGIASWSQVMSNMSYPHKMAAGDINRDGKADFASVEIQGDGRYRYMFGISNGTGVASWSQVMSNMTYAEFMDLGDVNNDGKADTLSVEAEGDGQYRFMFGIGNGAGVASWSQVMSNMSGPYFFNAGDVDGDGKDDIVSLEAM